MHAFAQRVAMKINDDRIRARFARMAFERLLGEPSNFRPASAAELDAGPDWPRAARARGDEIFVFTLNRGAAQRLHNMARRIAQTCKLAELDLTKPGRAAATAEARTFLDKFDRVNFDVASVKSRHFARILAALEDNRDGEALCPPSEIAAEQGRTWRRIVSVAELRAVGCEFRNCLARVGRDSSYTTMFRAQSAQYWVLRDAEGAGSIVAMAALPKPIRFTDVRGPRNAAVASGNPDLAHLAAALGFEAARPRPIETFALISPAAADANADIIREWLRAGAPPPLRRRVRRH
jgi:hypothetical protein